MKAYRMPETTRQMARSLLGKIPGGLETALLLRESILPLPPCFYPGKTFQSWLRELSDARVAGNSMEERRVLFFSYLPHWLDISLAIAAVLAARKCKVDFAFLPYANFERADLNWEEKKTRANYWKYTDRVNNPHLRFVDLTRLNPICPSEQMEEEARTQSLLDTKYVFKREEIDPDRDPDHQKVLEFRLRRNLQCMTSLAPLIKNGNYDVFIAPNGGSMEFGAAFRLARISGLKAISFEFGDRLGSIWISQGKPCTSIDTSGAWAKDYPHVLSPEARKRVAQISSTRQGVSWKGFCWSPQKSQRQTEPQEILVGLGIQNDNHPIVLMNSNIPWDSAMLGHDGLFSSLAEWIRVTTAYFAKRSDCWLIVRAHPGETIIGTGQPVTEIIRNHLPDLPSHVRVIGPDIKVNTYDLMEFCHFGITYTSITGLEMAMRGIPVVVSAHPHYGGKGFTKDVSTMEEYFETISALLAQEAKPRLSEREIELAWCYANVFYFDWAKPFPWHRATFWDDIEHWPLTKVLSSEGSSQFGAALDLLVDRVC